jgi:hypothetical protein
MTSVPGQVVRRRETRWSDLRNSVKKDMENTANHITHNAEILFQGFLESINGYNASIFKGGAASGHLQLTDRSRGNR